MSSPNRPSLEDFIQPLSFEPSKDTAFDLDVMDRSTPVGFIIECTDGYFIFEPVSIYLEQNQLEQIAAKLKELNNHG